jgi:hypothetical protein
MATDVLSYAALTTLVGRTFSTDAGTALVLEQLTRPWACDGRVSYSLLLSGPADRELAAGEYRLADGDLVLEMSLEPVARDLRFVHYEAVRPSAARTRMSRAPGTGRHAAA